MMELKAECKASFDIRPNVFDYINILPIEMKTRTVQRWKYS